MISSRVFDRRRRRRFAPPLTRSSTRTECCPSDQGRFLGGMKMYLNPICRLIFAAAWTTVIGAAPAHAQTYPSRPITIVVPYPAGGVTDNLVRLLAERMKISLGQSIVVENIGGGGGTIGVDRVS